MAEPASPASPSSPEPSPELTEKSSLISKRIQTPEDAVEVMTALFDESDVDKSGYIDTAELTDLLRCSLEAFSFLSHYFSSTGNFTKGKEYQGLYAKSN